MGNDISEGAIVQHLAKTRIRAVEAGLEVPPPLRRGGTTSGSKAAKTQIKPKAIADANSGNDKEDTKGTEVKGKLTCRGGTTGSPMSVKSEPKIKKEPKSDLETDSDSDEDYVGNEALAKKKTTQKRKPSVEYDTESEDEEPGETINKGTPNDDNDDDTNSSDESSGYVAAGAPFLELPYDNSNSNSHTGSNTMATTSPLVSDSTVTSSSRRRSNSSESKVVTFRISGENLKQATTHDEMGRMPALKAEYPQVENTFTNRYGNNNPTRISTTPTTQSNSALVGNFQASLSTFNAMNLSSGWPNDSTMNLPANGYSFSSYGSQNAQGPNQFQYPYTSMPTTAPLNPATHGGLYQGIMDETHSISMNSFSDFQSSSCLNDTLVPDSYSALVHDDTSFEGKQAAPL